MVEQFTTMSNLSEQGGSPAQWALLSAHLPGHAALTIGICLLPSNGGALHIRLRHGWWQGLVEPEDIVFWEAFQSDFLEAARLMQPERLWDWLLSTPSHVIRSEVQPSSASWSKEGAELLDSLYDTYVLGQTS